MRAEHLNRRHHVPAALPRRLAQHHQRRCPGAQFIAHRALLVVAHMHQPAFAAVAFHHRQRKRRLVARPHRCAALRGKRQPGELPGSNRPAEQKHRERQKRQRITQIQLMIGRPDEHHRQHRQKRQPEARRHHRHAQHRRQQPRADRLPLPRPPIRARPVLNRHYNGTAT